MNGAARDRGVNAAAVGSHACAQSQDGADLRGIHRGAPLLYTTMVCGRDTVPSKDSSVVP